MFPSSHLDRQPLEAGIYTKKRRSRITEIDYETNDAAFVYIHNDEQIIDNMKMAIIVLDSS